MVKNCPNWSKMVKNDYKMIPNDYQMVTNDYQMVTNDYKMAPNNSHIVPDESQTRFFIGSWTDIRDVVRPVKRALRPLRDPDHDPDHVHHGVHDLLRQEDGLSHVVIVRLNESLMRDHSSTQNWIHRDNWG